VSSTGGEFELVLGFDNLVVLWLFPMMAKCGKVEEQERPVLVGEMH
jgi:hypothetical protein